MVSALMQAMERGDHDQFAALLAEDVELHSDGGGKVAAATNPLHGRTTIMRFLLGLYRKRPPETTVTLGEVNGAPALFVRVAGTLDNVMNFEIGPNGIQAIRIVRNPEKLRHL
ncbi:MAG: nuclear transport factor 2 family protein [Caldilineaceae bacterium]